MPEHAYAAAPVRSRPQARGGRLAEGSALNPLLMAGLCVLALALIWVLAELVPAVRLKDAVTLYDFTTLNHPRLESAGDFLLRLLAPSLFILWGTALVAVAVAREQYRLAIAVVVILGFAPLTADILKPLLAHHHDSVHYVHIGDASWPSGHSTAASALAFSAVLVSPPVIRRGVAVLGAAFVLAVSGSLLMLAWHMPSDVLGGWFVAAFWVCLAVAGLRLAERRRPQGG